MFFTIFWDEHSNGWKAIVDTSGNLQLTPVKVCDDVSIRKNLSLNRNVVIHCLEIRDK